MNAYEFMQRLNNETPDFSSPYSSIGSDGFICSVKTDSVFNELTHEQKKELSTVDDNGLLYLCVWNKTWVLCNDEHEVWSLVQIYNTFSSDLSIVHRYVHYCIGDIQHVLDTDTAMHFVHKEF